MAVVLVTGGTGTLGSALVPRLVAAGHEVRVLSRRAVPRVPPGVATCVGDVVTGAGIDAAVTGCDAVIHAACSPRRRARETEVAGTRHVAAAARASGAHLVYVSIVGVDRHRFPYYKAKYAAEQVLAGSGAQWSVLRATQFHDFIDFLLSRGWFFRTPNLRVQPVDVGDVADALVGVAAGEPSGLLADFAGPEVLPIRQLVDTRREVTGQSTRLVPLPPVGFLRDYDAGLHLSPAHPTGTRTWRQWLQAGR